MLPGYPSIPPTYYLMPVHSLPSADQRLPINVTPPIPKPRVGQGRAGIRRKVKVTPPILKPIQTPTPPITEQAPRTARPLTEPLTQSQDSTIPQHHVPTMLQPLVEPAPPSITQPIVPLTCSRPIPPYHEPFVRPPPMPPDFMPMSDN